MLENKFFVKKDERGLTAIVLPDKTGEDSGNTGQGDPDSSTQSNSGSSSGSAIKNE